MQKISNHKKGFSLLELSIVIVIIGLLIVGVASGKSLIKNSRIASARSLTLSSQIVTIPGMVLWFETSTKESFPTSQIVDGAQITTWFNREPSGFLTKNNLTTPLSLTPPFIPVGSADVLYEDDGINFLPTVRMTKIGKMSLANFSESGITASTVIIVFRPNEPLPTLTSGALVLADSGSSSTPTSSIGITLNRVVYDMGSSTFSSDSATNPAAFVEGSPFIFMSSFNGNNSLQAFVNNLTPVGGVGAILNPGTNPLDGFTIGTDKSGSNGMVADVSEIIIYNRVLKDTERQDIMSYLSKKYKITVTGL